MNKEKGLAIIYEILLAGIGASGIISVPVSCLFPEMSLGRVWLGAFCCVGILLLILRLEQKKRLAGLGVIFAGVLLYIFFHLGELELAMMQLLNNFGERVRQESGILLNLSTGTEYVYYTAEEVMPVVWLLLLMISFITAWEVVYLRSMLSAVIAILPFLVLFITFSVVPSSHTLFLSILYVLGMATLKKKKREYSAGFIVMGLGVAAYLVVMLIAPQRGYARNTMFDALYLRAEAMIQSVSDAVLGINAPGGLNYGQLGKVSEIRFNDSVMATVRTIETGRNQYFKTYTGVHYQGDSWQTGDSIGDDVTEYLFNMMDSTEDLQQYATGDTGEEYYRNNKYYRYSLKENGEDDRLTTTASYSLETSDYSRFENIADGEFSFTTNYLPNTNRLTGSMFIRYENEMRRQARDSYTGLSLETSDLIREFMGDVQISTYSEKVEYINRVKAFLSNNYTYTVSPGRVPSGEDFLEYFLRDSKEGYCTYFASAATMMFRYARIPARYCEGYVVTNDKVLAGTKTQAENGRYSLNGSTRIFFSDAYEVKLTDRNAHAWVEIYMDGYGWIPIEVTPGSSNRDSLTTAQITSRETVDTEMDVEEEIPMEEETEAQRIPSHLGELEENLSNERQMQIRNFLKATLVGIIALLLLVLLLHLRKSRIYRARQQYLKQPKEGAIEEQISSLYEYLLQLLKALGYRRPADLEYEQYMAKLEMEDEQLKACGVSRLMFLLLKGRFYKEAGLTSEEFLEVRKSFQKLQSLVYERNKGLKLLKNKYIDVL